MNLSDRIELLDKLGHHLRGEDALLQAVQHRTQSHNPWLTVDHQKEAIAAIAAKLLPENKLRKWASNYPLNPSQTPKTVGIVMAGNIPLVGFHDFLCVFVSGNRSIIKLSDKDPYLLPYLLEWLEKTNPMARDYFEIVDTLNDMDAVIATGSNNTSRYFEAYFSKYPHLIRHNRNSVAVLTGAETDAELLALGHDIFSYFGLGCRNVSKIYVPLGFDFDHFLEILHEYKSIILHEKYKHNFDYNFALYSLNRTPFRFNGALILVENTSLQSRIASLHFEYFDSLENMEEELQRRKSEIQCVVAKQGVLRWPVLPFGKTQEPELWDYPDGVDVMEFLTKL